ncbi:efflux RND transporter periplasmic adaptor subunit [Rhodoplanes azumiensis]|uniref:Efflux RND transporter periplasmic adaptor subunit n=1 Tax=Rhodoplanes azumiensis TaxID=1897628 RepID=A0ABW5AFP6_9BRAD
MTVLRESTARESTARGGPAEDAGAVPLLEAALWKRLAETDEIASFCAAWIALQAGMVEGAVRGAVLGSDPAGPVTRVLATWPDGAAVDDLGPVATLALQQGRGVVRKGGAPDDDARCRLAFPILVDDHAVAAAVLALRSDAAPELRTAMRQLQWGVAWLRERLRRDARRGDDVASRAGRLLVDLFAAALEAETAEAAGRAVVTGLAHAFDCERVSLGFLRRGRVRVAVISHSAQFGRDMTLVRLIGDAMDEAVDQRAVVLHPAPPDDPVVTRAAAALAASEGGGRGDGQVLTIPMMVGEAQAGAVVLERREGTPFTRAEVETLDAVVAALAPLLDARRRDDRWLIAKIADSLGTQMVRLLGPGWWGRKLTLLAAGLLGVAGYAATDTYRITADAVVEGQVQRAVTAPFNGFVKEAPVRAGDQVTAGQLLARLDDRDLVLERLRWVTERQRKILENERALGDRNRAEVKITAMQIEQAEAQIGLVDEHLARAALTAPFAGLVVSGDLTQAIGATVQRGQVLFEVAPLDAYRVMLEVDETQIADVTVGQPGRLVVTAMPADTIPIAVVKITPVSKAHDGRNYFRVEAKVDGGGASLRPGMRGVAKLDVAARRVVWIWSRAFVDWLRLFVWRWTG